MLSVRHRLQPLRPLPSPLCVQSHASTHAIKKAVLLTLAAGYMDPVHISPAVSSDHTHLLNFSASLLFLHQSTR